MVKIQEDRCLYNFVSRSVPQLITMGSNHFGVSLRFETVLYICVAASGLDFVPTFIGSDLQAS